MKMYFGPILVVNVREPEDIKTVLNSEYCFEKPFMIYRSYFTYGLLTSGGDINKLHRKMISPLFYPTNLQSYLPVINKVVTKFLNNFDNHLSLNEIEMSHYALKFTLNSTILTLFGVDNISEEAENEFLKNFDG